MLASFLYTQYPQDFDKMINTSERDKGNLLIDRGIIICHQHNNRSTNQTLSPYTVISYTEISILFILYYSLYIIYLQIYQAAFLQHCRQLSILLSLSIDISFILHYSKGVFREEHKANLLHQGLALKGRTNGKEPDHHPPRDHRHQHGPLCRSPSGQPHLRLRCHHIGQRHQRDEDHQ